MSLPVVLVVALVCLLAEGFFSGSEIAIVNADRLKLQALAKQGNVGARIVLKLFEKPQYVISTCLVGTNISEVTGTTVVTMYLLDTIGYKGEWISILIMSPLIILFGEIIPKSIYQYKSTQIAVVVAYPILVFYYLFAVVVRPLTLLGNTILYLATGGDPERLKNPFLARDIFRRLIVSDELTAGGDLKRDEKQMISRVLDFGTNTAEDIMVPLIEVKALPAEARIGDLLDTLAEEEFSRYPVYEERIDNVVGILYTFDILKDFDPDRQVREVMRKAYFVPETMPLDELLHNLQSRRLSMAIVVDEFGGAVGIITMEDILEEIVGEIEDEYDEPEEEPTIRQLSRDKFFMDARVEIDLVNEMFPGLIPEGDYTTLAGLVLHHFKRIPEPGEGFFLENGLRVQVMEVTEKSVESVLLTVPPRFWRRRLRKKQVRAAAESARRQRRNEPTKQ